MLSHLLVEQNFTEGQSPSPSAQSLLLGATRPARSLAGGCSCKSLTAPAPPSGPPALLPLLTSVASALRYHPPRAPSARSCCPQLYHGLQSVRGQGHSSGAPPVSSCVTFDHLFPPFCGYILSPLKWGWYQLPHRVKKDSTSYYIQSAWDSAGHVVSTPQTTVVITIPAPTVINATATLSVSIIHHPRPHRLP